MNEGSVRMHHGCRRAYIIRWGRREAYQRFGGKSTILLGEEDLFQFRKGLLDIAIDKSIDKSTDKSRVIKSIYWGTTRSKLIPWGRQSRQKW